MVQLPVGWASSDPGLPDMAWPDDGVEAGYQGELWTATRGTQRIEVRWMGNHANYVCRVFLKYGDDENPAESRTFHYPHEIIDWMAMWFQNMGPFEAQE